MSNETKQPTLPEAIALATLLASAVKEHPDFDDGIPDSSKPLIELAEKALAALDSLQVGEPVTDHIEDVRGMVYAFRRKGQDAFCTCDEYRYNELSDKPHLFETTIFYTHPADCPRCAELEATNRQLNMEVISVGDEAEDYAGKLAALEADLAAANERIEELSFDAAMANQAREIGNHFSLTYMQVWSDTSIAFQVIDKMKEQQATIAQQAERIAELEKVAKAYEDQVAAHNKTLDEVARMSAMIEKCEKALASAVEWGVPMRDAPKSSRPYWFDDSVTALAAIAAHKKGGAGRGEKA